MSANTEDSPIEVDNSEMVEDNDEEEETVSLQKKGKVKKKKMPGVIYLSTIPPGMTVQDVRNIFSKYGLVGRMYLQPFPGKKGSVEKPNEKRKVRRQNYCEGWVEFMDKKIAKGVAGMLNNRLIGGKRKSPFRDYIWNIKYLHRFKWFHLNERTAYEKASHTQRMRTEIAQVKKETDFYVDSVQKSRDEIEFRRNNPTLADRAQPMVLRQRETDEEIRRKKQDLGLKDEPDGPDLALLQSVFGSR